jgi:hypothetical protein
MLNAPPPRNDGMISGRNVSTQPSERNSTNCGTSVTTSGSIIVDSSKMNSRFRPGNLNRAKPYATSEHVSRVPISANSVIVIVFVNQTNNGARANAST